MNNNVSSERMEILIVGLDLAGVENRPTGFCKLAGLKAETAVLFTDRQIIERTVQSNPQVIAIDAPLCLPPGRKTIEERNASHLRESDRKLLKMGIKLFPVTLGPMRKLTVRGIQLREYFQEKGFRVIEAYPGGAQDVLGIPRKQKGIDQLRAGLEKLGIEWLANVDSDHILDAATCAYTGKLFLEGKAVVYGDPLTGIVMPKGKKVRQI
jgi:predicted nuclease with RNAse H fold